MGAFKLGISLDGKDPESFTELLIQNVDDFRELWPVIARAYRRDQARRFRTQGSSSDTPWPKPLDTGERDFYALRKARILGLRLEQVNERALLWKGGRERLRPSFVNALHPEHVDDRTKRSITLGSRVPYAHIHDEGIGRAPAELGGHPIPRRDLKNVSRAFRRALLVDIVKWAGTQVDAARYSSDDIRKLL